MTKQTIEVDVPEGWKAVAFRIPVRGENYINRKGRLDICLVDYEKDIVLIVEKIQPRRIVLEETAEDKYDLALHDDSGCWTYWSKVTETEDSKLSLSVDDCKSIIDMSWGLELLDRLKKFIKENS